MSLGQPGEGREPMRHRAARWDRWLAVAALAATVMAMAGIVLLSVSYQRAIGNSGLGEWSTRGVVIFGVLFGLPLALEIGACLGRGTLGRALRWAAAAALGLLILLFAFGGGIFFVPATGLMVASAVVSTGSSTPASGSGTPAS